MMQTEHETSQDIHVNTGSRAHIHGVCAFFLILTALAIYVMLTSPATEF